MARKGLSLPINLIVILAIAILVLVVVAGYFIISAGMGFKSISDQAAWGNGCATAITRGCNLADFQLGSTTGVGLKIGGYDPSGNDQIDANGLSVCSSNPTHDTCNDNTLYTACTKTQGVSGAAACRAKCCG